MKYDYLVVGAGFYGAVIAERIANDLGATVLVIDKRSHIGGNCYSEIDRETGIEFHTYGTHIFHTSSKKVWDYITKFTAFNGYHHQVLTIHRGKVYQMPINLETINSFYGLNLRPYEVDELLRDEAAREGIEEPRNLEEKAISQIGRPLYEAFIKGYTIKQWNKPPTELPVNIISRLPVRHNYQEDYFLDSRWQGIPLEGYTKIFERMLTSPRIRIELNCDFFDCREAFKVKKKIVYTGPIDRYFDYTYGHLEWRTIELKRKVFDVEDYQGTSVMNYADEDVKYTRIHEPKHLHPERRYNSKRTVIFYEYSTENSADPYYPIRSAENTDIFQKYQELANKESNLILGGRLGDYAYYDMDKTIAAALKCYEKRIIDRVSPSGFSVEMRCDPIATF